MIKIKKIILLCLILLTAGCSVEYDLNINEDLSITEKVIAKEKTKKMESLTRLKGDNAVSYLYNTFKRDNEKFNLNSRVDGNTTVATVTTSHSNIDIYSKKFKSDIFKKVDIQRDGNIVNFSLNQSIPLTKNTNYSLVYDDITIKIYVPFKVIENNADNVYGNNYVWKINKKNALKNINIKYDEGSKKNSVNIKINNQTYNINYAIIVISGIILLVAVIALIVAIKNKRNNSF